MIFFYFQTNVTSTEVDNTKTIKTLSSITSVRTAGMERAEFAAHKPCSTKCFPDPWTQEPKSLPEGWGVVGDDNELGFALTQCLQGLLVAQEVLARLHHQSQPGIDVLRRLFLQVIYAQKSECNGQQTSCAMVQSPAQVHVDHSYDI